MDTKRRAELRRELRKIEESIKNLELVLRKMVHLSDSYKAPSASSVHYAREVATDLREAIGYLVDNF